MKYYEEPIVDVIRFAKDDIIVTSGGSCGGTGCPSDTEEDESF